MYSFYTNSGNSSLFLIYKNLTLIQILFIEIYAMTKYELKAISTEIDCISEQLSILDPDNPIENQMRERLLYRWDFLDYQLEQAFLSARNRSFRIIH